MSRYLGYEELDFPTLCHTAELQSATEDAPDVKNGHFRPHNTVRTLPRKICLGSGVTASRFCGVGQRLPDSTVHLSKVPDFRTDLHLPPNALGSAVHRILDSSPCTNCPMSPAEQSPGSQHAAALKASQLPDSQGTAKRRRTRGPRPPSHQACVACKARKVRCDAVRPTCAYCNARNIDCVYPPAFKRASCSAAYVASPLSYPRTDYYSYTLRSHVASLESRLSELEDR
jgi:hypothetical protein